MTETESRAEVSFVEPKGRSRVAVGRTLLDAVQAARLEVSSFCAGRGVCGKCRVVVVSGSENLSPLTSLERMSLTDRDIGQGFRIACCAGITLDGSITVRIPAETLTDQQQLLVAGIQAKLKLNPTVAKHFLRLTRASLTDSRSDLERLVETARAEFQLEGLRPTYMVLKGLPEAIRKGDWEVALTVADGDLITSVESGQRRRPIYGFAIDIGTTKMAGYLVDLASGEMVAKTAVTNPQVAFGGDVISRISYASKEEGKLVELQRVVVEAANSLVQECCAQVHAESRDVFHIVVVGNTVMHHIFLGITPEYVGLSPYTPAFTDSFRMYSKEVGITANPGCILDALPCVSGFVGADAVADILATQMHASSSLVLLVDIGTNTEIVLGKKDGLVCCSSPSGPAFEGAQIKNGMRAEVGAIERVWIDPSTLEPEYTTIGGTRPRGICGSGVIDAVASMRLTGIIDLEGRINSKTASERIRGAEGKGEYVLARKEETQTGRDITITQADIEEIKLAKAAVYTGIVILARHLGIQTDHIERIYIAGAFGTCVDPLSARTIGMYPDIPLGRISFVGNTAGSGARMALLSKDKLKEAQQIAKTLKCVELAAQPDFQKEFIDSLYIPHKRFTRAGAKR